MKIAVFVDAGYVYALCCIARFNAPQPRVRVSLDVDAVLRQLKFEAAALDGGGGRLIRIYWYDGAPKSGMTADQARVAAAPDVKLRLGSVNQYGEQKGVDALIAHDLSELARNHAIDTAILVSGDEDILVGVQTAQSFGVRVHLLGIDPLHSQAQRLRYEADVCHEWSEGMVAPWLALRMMPGARPFGGGEDDAEQRLAEMPYMSSVVEQMYPAIEGREYAILDQWDRGNRIAREIDSQLMRLLSSTLGRQLSPQEKPSLRQGFIDALRTGMLQADAAATDETTGDESLSDEAIGADGAALGDGAGANGMTNGAIEGAADSGYGASASYGGAGASAPEVPPETLGGIANAILPAIRDRIPRIVQNWEEHRRLPVDVNVHLLKAARDAIGREVENRAALRDAFMDALRSVAGYGEEDQGGAVSADASVGDDLINSAASDFGDAGAPTEVTAAPSE